MLRALVEQRLTAATEEISGLFERRMEENSGELLDSVYNTQLRLHRADVQQLLVVKEEDPTEQQEWSSSLDQEDPDPPHIKEEPEDFWTSQEGEQLQRLEEADMKFPFTSVFVKSEEDDEEKAQSSQLHERQTEENREAEHLKREADGEDCGGSESSMISDPDSPLQPATHDETSPSSESETDDSRDWEETKEPQSGSDPLLNNEVSVSDMEGNTGETSISSKRFLCSVCGKTFTQKTHLREHLTVHTGEKPFSCSVCGRGFARKTHLREHSTVHTGEKPFSCTVCGRGFARKTRLREHSTVHTE
ncbi:zinc finger and SCAN domain-containing protein 12-like isoform X6 [Sebastes umbrosus]|uniref:zinc finger and SCAN domain-containing protein 12-like isoform X6 n=1 Tax=Sebastes umbrosus TaxID=72105 RepID=UPI0018A05290|nr:zinc finger and SCAN domain-containing protein 12-like isoform X6 [Sebastes umbrosus]